MATTGRPAQSRPSRRRATRKITMTTKVPATVNSYMLPQGTRFGSAAMPRPSSDTNCSAQPSPARSSPSRPVISARCDCPASAGRSGVSGPAPPAPTATFSAAATGTFRSDAHCTRYASRDRK